MMKVTRFLVVAAVLGLAVSAQAATTTVFSGGIFDWVVTDSGTDPNGRPLGSLGGPEDLYAVMLSIVNPNPANTSNNPQAFDSKASGFAGITGTLHQHYSAALTPTTPQDGNNYTTAIDTHFFLNGVPFAFDSGTGAPEEDQATNGPSAQASDAVAPFDGFANTDFGSYLTMTGTQTGTVDATWDLARIVVPVNSTVNVEAQVANAAGGKDAVANFSFQVPPAATGPTPPYLTLTTTQDLTLQGTVTFDPLNVQIVTPPSQIQAGTVGVDGLAAHPDAPLIALFDVDMIGPNTLQDLIDALNAQDTSGDPYDLDARTTSFGDFDLAVLIAPRPGDDLQYVNFDFTGIADITSIGIIPTPAALPLGLASFVLTVRRRRAA